MLGLGSQCQGSYSPTTEPGSSSTWLFYFWFYTWSFAEVGLEHLAVRDIRVQWASLVKTRGNVSVSAEAVPKSCATVGVIGANVSI